MSSDKALSAKSRLPGGAINRAKLLKTEVKPRGCSMEPWSG